MGVVLFGVVGMRRDTAVGGCRGQGDGSERG